ncbi:DUF6044 family protein [Metabacillus idriensis]|uniref:YkoS n=1 Tax=Metabacillus idriensis TaxID=324768 RepID=A0A6I2M6T8_9BACI|nr:DUF6044 family protein [Metabacillus idriensis]MCM3595759.1 DUF6044 family protein [Metabacillus idriensis]MRX53870.1 hypothetical protein [Metabacillus idriensis]
MEHKRHFDHILIYLCILAIGLYVAPLFILNENAHIRVHDNLDSNLAWYKVLTENGYLLSGLNETLPQIINGLPRNALGSEWNLQIWLYNWFPTMTAYAFSQSITRIFAFLGMYLLLKDHFLTERQYWFITAGTALTFALTPFWPQGMLSTLGMPLALWAFLNIRNGNRYWLSMAVLTLLPFYSSFVLGFFFFLTAIGILWLMDVMKKKKWNLPFLISIGYMIFVYCIVEYRLIYSFLFSSEPNSRDEYFHARLPLWRVIRLTFKNFVLGHTHVMTVHGLIILPVTLFALYIIIRKGKWKTEKPFVFLFILNFCLSAWYAFWFYKGWLPLTERFHFMDTFNFARFHFLRPIIIYVGFALGLKILYSEFPQKGVIGACILAQVIVLGLFNDEIIYQKKPSVKEFYAEEQFAEIKEHIGLPVEDYRVASLGLHPAIAQYNGFYTLDTYNNFYPLSYKYQFRKIIENELSKNKRLRIYFDEWGGRCYLFSSELGKKYMFTKNSTNRIKDLDLNTVPFKKMGGEYIFSSLPIEQPEKNHLILDKVFHSEESAWKIYLYKAK